MNRDSSSTIQDASGHASTDRREMFVTSDFGTIPAAEMRPMFDGVVPWLSTVVAHKVLRKQVRADFAIDLRRMVNAKHVPKRMQKYFDDLQAKLESLSFARNYYASIPAIGPYSCTVMAMSRRDGDLHFFASQVVTQIGGQIHDEAHFWFTTWLSDGTSIVSMSPATRPRPGGGVDRVIFSSGDPAIVLKKHRDRLRKRSIEPVMPTDLFQRVEGENQDEVDDLLRRKVIRVATAAEVTRIRTQM